MRPFLSVGSIAPEPPGLERVGGCLVYVPDEARDRDLGRRLGEREEAGDGGRRRAPAVV